ncbi:hypothetical protein BGZ76_001087 [Entomortierella beljakovae]|nr:hypothetical protein BGZ76_001087 [Entomortierella beljakovae]
MKFTTVIAAASLAAIATALPINNPQAGTTWTVGQTGYLSWSGDCTSMGNSSHAVKVQLMTGESNALEYKADLGTIDCSNSTEKYLDLPSVPTGKYSLQILTVPQVSYSAIFTINNPAQPPASSAPATPSPSSTPPPTSAGSMVAAGSMTVLLGGVVAALQLLL